MSADETKQPVTYTYRFTFMDGTAKEHTVQLDRQNLSSVRIQKQNPPEWTQLDFCKCPNCPLDSKTNQHCPAAVKFVPLVELFKDSASYQQVDVEVTSAERKYNKRTSLQNALSSLMGLIAATSGCPILGKLRPMVETHLPFASLDESTYRIVSMYLTAQYFTQKSGGKANWDLKGLIEMYDEIQKVNHAFCERLNSVQMKDANVNALVILNTLGDWTNFSIEADGLKRLETIFKAYTDSK